jgi:hypothetical protein
MVVAEEASGAEVFTAAAPLVGAEEAFVAPALEAVSSVAVALVRRT